MSLTTIFQRHRDPFDDAAAGSLVKAVEVECVKAFPPLSPLDRERQHIEIKRKRLQEEITQDTDAIAHYDGEAARIRVLRDERLTILAGLDKHEAEINGATRPALDAIDFDELAPDENYPSKAPVHSRKRAKKPVLQAAE
jgi:hypothetical protein